MAGSGWRSDEVLAWTEREGPGRPPAAPSRWVATGLAAGLGAVLVGMLSTDALCPDHRAWVQALGSVALLGVIVAIVGLVRRSAIALPTTLVTAGLGVVIGFIDAVHDPTRGHLIAMGFGLAGVASAWMAFRQLRLLRWERRVYAGLAPGDAGVLAGLSPEPAAPSAETGSETDLARPTTR